MKKIVHIFLCGVFISITAVAQEKTELNEIQAFQSQLNEQFRSQDRSPLTDADRDTFKSLEFFEVDLKYRVVAKVRLTPDAPVFTMTTTTDRLPLYRKYAVATFEIDGVEYQLSLYQNQKYMMSPEYDNTLFIPFSDKTNGTESYGGGRYMDVPIPEEGVDNIVLDFNQTYNPYCAYNKKYSCPIPPRENVLSVAIRAGIKNYIK